MEKIIGNFQTIGAGHPVRAFGVLERTGGLKNMKGQQGKKRIYCVEYMAQVRAGKEKFR